jgi:glycolate oxidase FAD binding subunit
MHAAPDGIAEQVRRAAGDGRRLYPRGTGRWWPDPPPDASPLDLTPWGAVSRFDVADLVATAGAGCRLDRLATALGEQGAWLALDPPGPADRTLGGALAAGGGGPLAAGYGPPRDQVLGMTVVAGNGTTVRIGGRVVKNVAGFDLAKAVIGGHGGFGVITEVHLRLRARAEADATRAWAGSLGAVAAASARLLRAGAAPHAFEALSPPLAGSLGLGDGWTLALRAIGTARAAEEELEAAAQVVTEAGDCREVTPTPYTPHPTPWEGWRGVVGSWPVILRVGADPAAWTDAVTLGVERLGLLLGVSVTVPRGTVRIGADHATPDAVRGLRAVAARRGWPVTLERADATTRQAVGVWGALAPGVRRLTEALRATYDPNGVFAVPLLA